MLDYEKKDDELYKAIKRINKDFKPEQIWKDIKKDEELLRWAIKPTKDKFGEKDLVNGLAICDYILKNYEDINKDIYQELVNLIYSNRQIARIVEDGFCNGGNSFLLLTLKNPNLVLTQEQKDFAVSEAMNKIGTVKYDEIEKDYSRELDNKGITDETTTSINIDGSINPIGLRTQLKYMKYLFSSISDSQAHGIGSHDIRYYILKNKNWTLEEKYTLVRNFYADDLEYASILEEWEWTIVNYEENYKGYSEPLFSKEEMYDYSYDSLLKFYGDKKTTDRVWKEIQFCKTMHQLRPDPWELANNKKQSKTNH